MLAGAALSLDARSVKRGFAIGVISHLLLDAVPHRDYNPRALGGLLLAVDLTGGAFSVYKLSRGRAVVLAGALGGLLPDLLRPAESLLRFEPFGALHRLAHTAARPAVPASLLMQTLTAAAATAVLIRGRR